MTRIAPLLLLSLFFHSCGFEEFDDKPPIQIMGYVMLDSNSPAVVDTFTIAQMQRFNEERDYWTEEIITDSNGFFFFEYLNNNKKHGGPDCARGGGIFMGQGRFSIIDQNYFASCFPANVSMGPVVYLNKDARIELLYNGRIDDGDTLFFSVPPLDTLHPNYLRRSFQDETIHVLAIPGPRNDVQFRYHAANPNPVYEGWNNGLRGEFKAYSALNWDSVLIKHFNQDSFAFPLRLKGVPFEDRVSIANRAINYYD